MSLKPQIQSQYLASLSMLLTAIEKCPPDLWTSPIYTNPCWQIAYHTLYYADLYLRQTEADFIPWEGHRSDYHRLGPRTSESHPLVPYSQAETLIYGNRIHDGVPSALERLDLAASDSGFSWYQMPKLEHQLVNLRHIHHHTGQLTDRIRQATGHGFSWVKGVPV